MWKANPARIPQGDGMAAITAEPLVYLRDLAVSIAAQPDGRTARVEVLDNDRDTTGDRPPIVSAEILVSDDRDGLIARTPSDASGLSGFAIPADMEPADLRLAMCADGFNPRHMLLDGTNLALDVREALYGVSSTN